jgi:hypothetical protein
LTIQIIFNIILEPPQILPLSFGAAVLDEGGFAQVSCIVTKGDQPLKISWSFHGNSISSDLGISTMPMGPSGSALLIPSVGHRHRGNYTCKAANLAGTRFQTVELKVNGKTRVGTGNISTIITSCLHVKSHQQ